MFTPWNVLVTLLLTSSSLAATTPRSIPSTSFARGLILARQDVGLLPDDIPSQCESQCAAIVALTSDTTCEDETCVCQDKNVNALVSCFKCLLSLDPGNSAAQTASQDTVDKLVDACNDSGNKVKSASVTGKSGKNGAVYSVKRDRLAAAAGVIAASILVF